MRRCLAFTENVFMNLILTLDSWAFRIKLIKSGGSDRKTKRADLISLWASDAPMLHCPSLSVSSPLSLSLFFVLYRQAATIDAAFVCVLGGLGGYSRWSVDPKGVSVGFSVWSRQKNDVHIRPSHGRRPRAYFWPNIFQAQNEIIIKSNNGSKNLLPILIFN